MESLSVVIPVYNCGRYLENCITSVAAVNDDCKTMFVHEIILVDDGSTDGSSELCDKLASKQRSETCAIRVIHQANRGVSAARNAGVHMATGSFVLFVDSDDTVNSKKLAELMQKIAQDPSVDMAVFGLSFDYYSGNQIYRQDFMLPPIEGIRSYSETSKKLETLFKSNMLSPLWNKLIRRSVLEKTGISLREDMFLYEDLEFSLRVLAQCDTIYFCREPIYHYRQAPDEGNAGRRLKRIAHISEIVDKVEEALIPFGDGTGVLLPLHLILAREKIDCASKEEIKTVCDDFKKWIDQKVLKSKIVGVNHAMRLYNGQIYRLQFQRAKTKIRHRIANRIKKTFGDFRKW